VTPETRDILVTKYRSLEHRISKINKATRQQKICSNTSKPKCKMTFVYDLSPVYSFLTREFGVGGKGRDTVECRRHVGTNSDGWIQLFLVRLTCSILNRRRGVVCTLGYFDRSEI